MLDKSSSLKRGKQPTSEWLAGQTSRSFFNLSLFISQPMLIYILTFHLASLVSGWDLLGLHFFLQAQAFKTWDTLGFKAGFAFVECSLHLCSWEMCFLLSEWEVAGINEKIFSWRTKMSQVCILISYLRAFSIGMAQLDCTRYGFDCTVHTTAASL